MGMQKYYSAIHCSRSLRNYDDNYFCWETEMMKKVYRSHGKQNCFFFVSQKKVMQVWNNM